MNILTGTVIGAILGFLLSLGYMTMNIKKSQRSTLFPIVAISLTLFGAVSGGSVGFKVQKSEKISKTLGLDKINYSHYKVGRFWECQSTWNELSGKRHNIRTFKNNNNTVSYYNGGLICTHGSSASSVNISRYHIEAREAIFSRLRKKLEENEFS